MRKVLFLLLLVPVCAAAYYFYPEKKIPAGTTIDRLVVYKHRHRMEAYAGNTLVKVYTVAIGRVPVGHKQQEGDKRTPEGQYRINEKNPHSGYHKNLGISYPNIADRKTARAHGVPPGGEVKIHGLKNGRGYIGKFHRFRDWTNGCIALTDEEVDELYDHVILGATIVIYP